MSPPIHLVRIDPDMALVARWWHAEQLTPPEGADDGYAWHALLAAAFGPLAPKPFRVFVRRGRPLHLLAYADADAAKLVAQALEFADPVVFRALQIETLETKPLPAFGE